jgi:hypothetical protein
MTIPRIPLQFRLGRGLLEDIDDLVLDSEHDNRNAWMIAAINRRIERGWPIPYGMTAEYLLRNKKTIMVRLDELTLEIIDEQCDEKEIARTMWLLDAMISYLAEQRS